MRNEIILGDCLEVMKGMAENSIDCVLTDPPYFLTNSCGSGFMGKSWDSIHGLSRYLWENNTFVNSALKFLNGLCLVKNMAEENIAHQNVNTKLSQETRQQIKLALSVQQFLQHTNAHKKDSALLLVLTKQEVSDLLKELCPSHIKMQEGYLNGVSANALYVIPISLLQKEINHIAHSNVLQNLKVKDIEAKEIQVTSMDQAVLKSAIEETIGKKSESWSTSATNGNARVVSLNAKENKYSVITSCHTEKAALMTWITSLLCAINATQKSSTIHNYLIDSFYQPIFKEVWRVCKPGAPILVFGGTRTYHRLACAIEDVGFEIRDCLSWNFGSGFPKSHNHFGLPGYGTALKPAYEPILLCMKPLEGTFKQNAEKWGVAGINIDACRIGTIGGTEKGTFPKEKSNGIYGNGINGLCEIKALDKGRWPANVLFDEEAAKMLDEQSGMLKTGKMTLRNHVSKRNVYPQGFKTGNSCDIIANSGGASRFFYCAKASSKERGEENKHPTVKPLKLLEYLLKLIMPPSKDAIVLDPFAGSGSTILAAKNLGFNSIGIEKQEDYYKIAVARTSDKIIPINQYDLFDQYDKDIA